MTILIVGLGNPGLEYEKTRHNVGFYVVDALAEHFIGESVQWKEKWRGLTANGSFAGNTICFVKPQTYMNMSGESVVRYCNFFKIPMAQVVIVHDDIDMAPARIKCVRGGGNGGHNGIKSLVKSLGESSFYRLKIGVGRPGVGDVHPDFPVEKYVLSAFRSEEVSRIDERKEALCIGFRHFLHGDIARAVGVFNSLKD